MVRQIWPCVALLLAACAASGSPAPPPGTAQALFTGAATIQVTASDYVPARAVTLVGPHGEVPAVSIDTTTSPGYAAAPPAGGALSLGLGAGGRGTFGGIGFGFPLIGGGPAPAAPPTSISTAVIRVPTEPPYAEVWRHSEIRIQFGEPPAVRYISIPAPPPPQAS
jgi:hypothetical protein